MQLKQRLRLSEQTPIHVRNCLSELGVVEALISFLDEKERRYCRRALFSCIGNPVGMVAVLRLGFGCRHMRGLQEVGGTAESCKSC